MWLSLVVSEGKTVDNCFDRAKAQSKEPKKQSAIATRGDYATACKLRNAALGKLNNEMWLSLVERCVRDSITVLGVEFSRRAENP